MAHETGSEKELPKGFRWQDLSTKTGNDQFRFYSQLLAKLGVATAGAVREIFEGSKTCLSKPKHLHLLVEELDAIDWYAAREEGALADAYEGLLEKNSAESKSGAGQYFTPRPVIESVVHVVKPKRGEVIQDPACGTGGFLIAANRYIKQQTSAQTASGSKKAFFGVELVRDTHRLALMNAMLHGIEGTFVCGDTLDEAGATLPPADVILTNPPFGTKRGAGLPARAFPVSTSNKQLAFLQHVYLGLKHRGRAAVVMPDLTGPAASAVCANLMEYCRLHTILRLPQGIFYAPGVKTNVLFFERGKTKSRSTSEVWIYDLRSNMPMFGKRTPLTRDHFRDFERAFGTDPRGRSERMDEGEGGRFRCFSRKQIREHGDTLDMSWQVEGAGAESNGGETPEALAKQIMQRLQSALKELKAIQIDAKRAS